MKIIEDNLELFSNFKGRILIFPTFNIAVPLVYKCASTFFINVGGFNVAGENHNDYIKSMEPCIAIDTVTQNLSTEEVWKELRQPGPTSHWINAPLQPGSVEYFKKLSGKLDILFLVRNPYERICKGFSHAPGFQEFKVRLHDKWVKDRMSFDSKEFIDECEELRDIYIRKFNERLDTVLYSDFNFNDIIKRTFDQIRMDDGHSALDEHIKPYFLHFNDIEKMLKMDNFHVVNTKKLYNRLNEINKGFSYYSKFMQWSGAGDGSRSNFTVLDINFLKDNHPNIVKKINKVYNKDFELFNFEVMKIL